MNRFELIFQKPKEEVATPKFEDSLLPGCVWASNDGIEETSFVITKLDLKHNNVFFTWEQGEFSKFNEYKHDRAGIPFFKKSNMKYIGRRMFLPYLTEEEKIEHQKNIK